MKTPNFTYRLFTFARKQLYAVREVVPIARQLIRKPAILFYILLKAHRAQLVSVGIILFMIFVSLQIVDFTTNKIFPPKQSKKLFGLIKKKSENPAKAYADKTIMTTLWVTSSGVIFLLFWLSIPAGAARITAIAENNNTSADRTLHDEGYQPTTISKIINSQVSPHERYEIRHELGKGAMGVVYCARDNVLDRNVALKQLSVRLTNDEEYALRFRREAKALAQLTHPNIVPVYDFMENNGQLWMVLEFLEGGDLATYIRSGQCLSIGEIVNIIVQAVHGIAYAHDRGIIHRDLKPANILLTQDSNPKISDFGIAKLTQSGNLTQIGTVLGSPLYMSPEQASGDSIDSRCDIYALGITLYELVTGQVPFDGDTSSVLTRHIVEIPTPPSEKKPGIPKKLEDIILRMLAKDPDARPQDMHIVADLLAPFTHLEKSANK